MDIVVQVHLATKGLLDGKTVDELHVYFFFPSLLFFKGIVLK